MIFFEVGNKENYDYNNVVLNFIRDPRMSKKLSKPSNDRNNWLLRHSPKDPLQHWGIHLWLTSLEYIKDLSVKQEF